MVDPTRPGLHVWINGEPRILTPPMTVADLLEDLDLDVRSVAVERNKRIVKKVEFGSTEIEDGDRIEIVTLVGGG